MEKSKYEALRWNNDPYEDRQKDVACGPMFRTVIQQKIFDEVVLALKTNIAPQKAIDFVHIKKTRKSLSTFLKLVIVWAWWTS